jgi:uncharacterized protein YidB (DUF937 family)
MGLLDSILGAVSGKSDASGQAAPLIGVLSGLLAQSGGLQGLANKFSQSGQGDTFSSWVGMGENQSISANQIQNVLGSEQVNALAAKMGVDPAQASNFLAEYLPNIVDKLTPTGKVDPTRITSRVWLLCFRRSCKVFGARLPAVSPRRHNSFRLEKTNQEARNAGRERSTLSFENYFVLRQTTSSLLRRSINASTLPLEA